MTAVYVIRPLAAEDDRGSFDCGEPSLNDFLKRFARQNSEKGLSRTYVAVLPGGSRIYGYYTISSGAVRFDVVPENLPRYPIPVMHLGRLAVDNAAQGQRLGRTLLADALLKAFSVSRQMSIFAVEVYALNDSARDFYMKFGFVPLADDTNHLYLTIKKISKIIDAAR